MFLGAVFKGFYSGDDYVEVILIAHCHLLHRMNALLDSSHSVSVARVLGCMVPIIGGMLVPLLGVPLSQAIHVRRRGCKGASTFDGTFFVLFVT